VPLADVLHRFIHGPNAQLHSYELQIIAAVRAKLEPKVVDKLDAQLLHLPYRQRQKKDRSIFFFPRGRNCDLPEEILFKRGESSLRFAEVEIERKEGKKERLLAQLNAVRGHFFSIDYDAVPSRRGLKDGEEVNVARVSILADLEPPTENGSGPDLRDETALDSSRFRFPVIAAMKDGLTLFDSDRSLRLCTKQMLRDGQFNGLRIIDSDAIAYTVESAQYGHRTEQKAKPGLFAPFLIEVKLRVSHARRLSIHEVRGILNRGLGADRDLLENHPFHFLAVGRKIDQAESVAAIWQLVTPFLAARKLGTLPDDLIQEVRPENFDAGHDADGIE
jgi:hypothetical protein